MTRTLPALAFAALLAALLVGMVAAWEPGIGGLECTPGSLDCGDSPVLGYGLEPDASSRQGTYAAGRAVNSSSRGSRPPEVLGARSVPAKPTPTVAASPTPGPVSLGSFKVTSYTSCDVGMRCDGITYSGELARWGVVAVDVRVIPLHSRLIIDGLGEFVALDTGSGVIGRHVDIWRADRQEALRFGVQTRGVRLAQ